MQSALKRRKALSLPITQQISKFSTIGTCINAKMKIKYLKTQKLVSNYILQSLKISKLRNFQTKSVSVAQRQSVLVQNYFQFLVQQRFSNSNLRHVLDYESILIIIKSNIPSIRPFFIALLCPSKLLFYVHAAPSSSGIWSVSPFF